jgi:hypothetical protein
MRALIAVLTLIAAATPASAATAYRAGYEAFVGGFRVGAFETTIHLDEGGYLVRIDIESRGAVAWFVDLRSSARPRARSTRAG